MKTILVDFASWMMFQSIRLDPKEMVERYLESHNIDIHNVGSTIYIGEAIPRDDLTDDFIKSIESIDDELNRNIRKTNINVNPLTNKYNGWST